MSVADEREIEERLRSGLMLAEHRETLTQLLVAVRKARAEGGLVVHCTVNGERGPSVWLI